MHKYFGSCTAFEILIEVILERWIYSSYNIEKKYIRLLKLQNEGGV